MAAASDMQKMRLLVERGADVNARSAAGNTAIALASRLPSGGEAVRLLLRKGGAATVAVLRNALRQGDLLLARELISAGVKPDGAVATISAAAASGSAEALRLALTGVEELPKPAAASASPLMLAAFGGPAESVRLLLARKAGLNDRDSRGRTALMHAVAGPHPEPAIIRALIEAGADVSIKDTRGDTAAEWARLRGDARALQAMGVSSTAAPIPAAETQAALPPLRQSLQRGLALLDAAGPAFFKANGCISCHNQSIPQVAYARIRQAGVPVEQAGADRHTKAVLATWASELPNMWQTSCQVGGGQVATMTYGLVGLAAVGQPRTAAIDGAVHCLMALQQTDGAWDLPDRRAPLGIGREKFTALAIRGLQAYALPGRRQELDQRIGRARTYLEKAVHEDTQALVFRILGLRWAGGDADLIDRLTRELSQLQRADGGWAQRPEFVADAYATGQALWALVEGGGRTAADAGYRRGAEYLRRTQQSDGSWYVRSRGFGFQPYRETGFPHGHDQWLSAAGTGFALIGLAPMAALR